MDYLPLFVKVNSKRCLVAGCGEAAASKIRLLVKAGAKVRVVCDDPSEEVRSQAEDHRVELIERAFQPGDVDGCQLVFSATGDETQDGIVAATAEARDLPVNVVDRPSLCSFIMPAIIDRSPIVAAISSGGAAPVLARLLRARIETLIPSAVGRLAQFADSYRGEVKKKATSASARRQFWERIFQGPVSEHLLSGRVDSAEQAMRKELDRLPTAPSKTGEVYLVGSGPGDPDLLTFRALRLMQQADVVVYDRLVSEGVLDLTRREAERIYAGKRSGQHTLAQEDINDLLIRLANEGKKVLRLKGGDPFIFGRGGEEIESLSQENISFQVVPGITAASGCAAYAGIPLTHRDFAQSCTFVTGHLRDGKVNLNWKTLVHPNHTLVIYMGLIGLPVICRELIKHGLPRATPAALVQQGTTHAHAVMTGTVETLPGLVAKRQPKAPTLIIVGEVVKLRDKLNWFDG